MKLALSQIHGFFIVLALCLMCSQLSAQSLSNNEISFDSLPGDAFTRSVFHRALDFSSIRPVEKVYLHFDKPYYAAGSVCWYRAFVVNVDLMPTERSQVLYVDWINPSGQLLKHQQHKIVDGEVNGDYVLSDDSPEGTYTVRAYTHWMRNEDPDFFFSATFTVFNPSSVPDRGGKIPDPSVIDLQFFPEGGATVAGLQSQVAFKATDTHGKGVQVRGEILDESGKYVTSFESLHSGMGVFAFTPGENKTYKAKLPNGKVVDLPKADGSGFVMSVSNRSANSMVVRIHASSGINPTDFYLIGQSRGQVCFHGRFTLTNDFINVEIPKQTLPAGVMQLTLFDLNGIPRAERMVFINLQDRMIIDVESDKPHYGPREPIVLSILTTNMAGSPIEAALSLAVVDAGLVARERYHQNILTHLLLQSDMKGELEDPAWYFESTNRENVFALDLVMLTHGWRRFDWGAVLAQRYGPILFQSEQGLTLRGRVTRAETKKPLAEGELVLIAKGGGHEGLYIIETDSNGRFQIPDVDFNDSTTLVFVTRNEKGRSINSNVRFMEDDLPPITPLRARESNSIEKNEYLQKLVTRFLESGEWNAENARILEEVVITASRLPDSSKVVPFSSLAPKSYHSYVVRPSKNEVFTEVSQMISGRVPGVQFFGTGPDMQVKIRGIRTLGVTQPVSPLILLDGMPLSSEPGDLYFSLNSVPVTEVERIEILMGASAAMYGSRGGAGVIAIYTKARSNNDSSESGPGKGIVKLFKFGYEWPRQFYQPKYELEAEKSSGTPDQRVTLHWNPSIRTDKNGRATVRLFNSDATTVFQVVVEGISNGLPGALTKDIGH